MTTKPVQIPDAIMARLATTRLSEFPPDQQVRIVLALFLFERGAISFGKAAELAGEPRVPFQLLAAEMGIPAVRYELADYEEDTRTLEWWAQRDRDQAKTP